MLVQWRSNGKSVCFAVGRPGFNSLVASYQKTVKNVFAASLLGVMYKMEPASLLVSAEVESAVSEPATG